MVDDSHNQVSVTGNYYRAIDSDRYVFRNDFVRFEHKNLENQLKSGPDVGQKTLISLLNHIHFSDGHMYLRLQQKLVREEFLLRVKGDPCRNNLVKLHMPFISGIHLENFDILDLIMDDGRSVIVMPVETVTCEKDSCVVRLPEKGFIVGKRSARRFISSNVEAEISAADFSTSGTLMDFSFEGFCIQLHSSISDIQRIISFDMPLSVFLKRGQERVFSGKCSLIDIKEIKQITIIVVAPIDDAHVRFRKRKYRHPRVKLVPPPKISFIHPLSNKKVLCDISDIGATGFSVDEAYDEAMLVSGMLMSDVTILFPGGLKLLCSAQIVYRTVKYGKIIHYGFSIINMDTPSYCRLFDIVSHAHDPRCNMTSEIDMDTLWEFFFKSGFIYPKKYESLCPYKEEFKETYRKLYQDCQEIFMSITYQKNGKVLGHNCAIKAYQRAWMIYHLAAMSEGAKQIGLNILRYSHDFFDGMYRLPSLGMDYMVIYYRPDNKFPDYFFGGFCRHFRNPKACSMDTFSYLHYYLKKERDMLPPAWTIHPCNKDDFDQLRVYYEQYSGGLMFDMFGFDREFSEEPLEDTYQRLGLKRKSTTFALKENGSIKAVLMVDQSDIGTNLSELLNNIKIIVIDKSTRWSMLEKAISEVGSVYARENIPIMIYPFEYAQDAGIDYEKKYNLWIVNALFGDDYVDFIKRQLQFNSFKFIKYLIRNMIKK